MSAGCITTMKNHKKDKTEQYQENVFGTIKNQRNPAFSYDTSSKVHLYLRCNLKFGPNKGATIILN
jgi:hypothetical protein